MPQSSPFLSRLSCFSYLSTPLVATLGLVSGVLKKLTMTGFSSLFIAFMEGLLDFLLSAIFILENFNGVSMMCVEQNLRSGQALRAQANLSLSLSLSFLTFSLWGEK